MDRNGNIYAAAGELIVKDGKVQFATARSGHYQPDSSHMASLDAEFKRNGLGDVPILGWDGVTRIF